MVAFLSHSLDEGPNTNNTRTSDNENARKQLSHTHIRFNTTHVAADDATKFTALVTLAEIFTRVGKAEFNVYYQNVGGANSKRTIVTGEIPVTASKRDLTQTFLELNQHLDKDKSAGDELVPQDQGFSRDIVAI